MSEFTMRAKPSEARVSDVRFYDREGKSVADRPIIKADALMEEVRAENTEGDVAAKEEVFSDGTSRYFVKRATVGFNAGNFYAPYGATAKPNDLARYDTQSGRRYYEYKAVGENVFSSYLEYLRSRNPAHLRQAERSFLDA